MGNIERRLDGGPPIEPTELDPHGIGTCTREAEREAVMEAVAESFGACNNVTADRVLDALAEVRPTDTQGAVDLLRDLAASMGDAADALPWELWERLRVYLPDSGGQYEPAGAAPPRQRHSSEEGS